LIKVVIVSVSAWVRTRPKKAEWKSHRLLRNPNPTAATIKTGITKEHTASSQVGTRSCNEYVCWIEVSVSENWRRKPSASLMMARMPARMMVPAQSMPYDSVMTPADIYAFGLK